MEPERQEYNGHPIELRAPEAGAELELLVDNVAIPYGQLPDGSFALHEYAYDWSDNLIDLARKFVDYRDRAETIRRGAESRKGE
jgi:hypothetical protein